MKGQTSIMEEHFSLLLRAMENDDHEPFKGFIDAGLYSNCEILDTLPLLSLAACKNSVNVAKFLLDSGADIDIKSGKNWSPLYYAISADKYNMVRLLVDHGADILGEDDNGETPLCIAHKLGNPEIENFLRAKLDECLFSAVERKSSQEVKNFLDGGANIEARSVKNETPLCVASGKGFSSIVQFLVNKNANVNVRDDDGKTPLSRAVEGGHSNVVRILLNRDAMVDTPDHYDKAPLHYAAYCNREDIVRLLIDRDANVGITDKGGRTPLHYAAEGGHVGVAELLLERSVVVDTPDHYGKTPLHYAACYDRVDMVSFLIDRDANVEALDGEDRVPLHYAAGEGSIGVATFLVRSGNANVYDYDSHGKTPLHYAACYDRGDMISFLINEGINVEVTDKERKTPLHYAAMEGFLSIVKLLLQHGAVINIKDLRDKMPLDYALLHEKLDVVEFLKGRKTFGPVIDLFSVCTRFPVAHYSRRLSVTQIYVEDTTVSHERQRSSGIDYSALETSQLLSICGGEEGTNTAHFDQEINFLHEKGCLYDALLLQEENQGTSLHVAVEKNQIDLVKKLLCILKDPYCSNEFYRRKYFEGKQEGEKPLSKVVNTKNKHGKDVITLVIEGNNPECILVFFKCLAYQDINRKRDVVTGYTPLHEAVISESSSAISSLLESKHLDIQLMDTRSYKASDYVLDREVLELFCVYYAGQIDGLRKRLESSGKTLERVLCRAEVFSALLMFTSAFLTIGSTVYDMIVADKSTRSSDSTFNFFFRFISGFAIAAGAINMAIRRKLSSYGKERRSLQEKLDSFREERCKLESRLFYFCVAQSCGINGISIPLSLSEGGRKAKQETQAVFEKEKKRTREELNDIRRYIKEIEGRNRALEQSVKREDQRIKQLEQALEEKSLERIAIKVCASKLAGFDEELQSAVDEESEDKIVEAAMSYARGSPEQVIDAIIEEIKINREQIIKEGRVSAEIIEAGIGSFSNQGTLLSGVNVSQGVNAGMSRGSGAGFLKYPFSNVNLPK
ncbi:MAG: ankyrin repeat domain-containing protein [Wolbachia sp.]